MNLLFMQKCVAPLNKKACAVSVLVLIPVVFESIAICNNRVVAFNIPYSEKLWQWETLVNATYEHLWQNKIW